MIANLHDVLALVGPLDDRTGHGTPRGRLHQFIDEHGVDARSVRSLLAQCQERLGRQHACARQDLVVKLGECLGFEHGYGTYEPARGSLQVAGQWRSPGGPLLLLDIRSERTTHDDAEDLARAIEAVSGRAAPGAGRAVGLAVLTPFYVSRRPLESWLAQRHCDDIRCVTLDSLVWLAEMRERARLSHDEIVRLLTSGLDADFMIGLVRRLTQGVAALPASPAPSGSAQEASRPLGPHVWVAMLSHDETATPRQLLDSVIGRRQVLGVSRFAASAGHADHAPAHTGERATSGLASPAPKAGERVFFYIAGEGLAGHAMIDAVLSDAASVIRRASRFSAVCRLRDVDVYDVPRFVDPACAAGRVIYGAPEGGVGAVLHALDEADAGALWGAEPGRERAFVS